MADLSAQPLGTVLVTGGASGLGAATVQAVAAAGGRALVLDRVPPPDGIRDAVADFELVDLADARAAEAAVRAVADRGRRAGRGLHRGRDRPGGTLADVPGGRSGTGSSGQPDRHRGGGPRGAAYLERSGGRWSPAPRRWGCGRCRTRARTARPSSAWSASPGRWRWRLRAASG